MGNPEFDEGISSHDQHEAVDHLPPPPAETRNTSSTTLNFNTVATTKMAESSTNSPMASSPAPVSTPKPDEISESNAVPESTSVSSHPSPKDPNSAGHYGTRSRNRPGTTRPNYAEDVEMEYENSVHVNGNQDSTSSTQAAPSQQAAASSAPQKRVVSSTNGFQAVNSASNTNGSPVAPIPGTSTFSANPNVNVPKKRKAAQNAGTTQGALSQAAQTHSMSRRANASVGARESRETNLYSFTKTGAKLQNGKLVADDGTTFSVNDHVYLICEPPGDPYYLGRLMEFRTRENDNPDSPVEGMRINWVYRPRDVQRFSIDNRLVFATMHSDVCPLTSLRGKCVVSHKSEFGDLDEYKSHPDHFYYNQVFDRFMHRYFEVIPVGQVINVPENVKKALDERWKFIIVEASKVKEYTSDAKRCKRCSGYCANNDSVECAVCHNTYHMNCVQPPLLKKPSRGFAWACAPCSRAQERKLEARRTPVIGTPDGEAEEDDVIEEEEEEAVVETTAATPEAMDDRPATEAEVAHAKMWTMRYLGIHCRVEDALQYDDRAIYPRASSRLGPKHQANTVPWYGRPVELVKVKEIKKKYVKGPGKKDSNRLTKETLALLEADRASKVGRPKWVQDEPVGYVHRGEDHPNKELANTARTCFILPSVGEASTRGFDDQPLGPEKLVDAYMVRAKKVAKEIGVKDYSTDFLDRAIFLLQENGYDADAAIKQLKRTDPVGKWPEQKNQIRKDLRDPERTLSTEEKKRFEEGVSKYGSELRLVRLHVKTLSHADIVRYWYIWKKTDKGKAIWGSYGGRKNTKKLKADKEAAAKVIDDIADDADDSAFDNDKIDQRARKMICKYCNTKQSRVWRRAPGVSPGETIPGEGRGASKKESLSPALCQRCARLWRKYAIKWENMDEIMKKLTQVGSKSWKKKLDPELLKEIENFNGNKGNDVAIPEPFPDPNTATEPSKKKARLSAAESAQVDISKKKPPVPVQAPPPRLPSPPLIPATPTMKEFACFVCDSSDASHDTLLRCRDCRLSVHRRCYGQPDVRDIKKWSCDMCANDRKESAALAGPSKDPASYEYSCILCPVHSTPRELVELPKSGNKKKTEKEKVKEQQEKELGHQLAESYRSQQREKGRPILPREALKRTADNNWAHVTCAVFLPDIKFSNSKSFEAVEGVPIARRNSKDKKCIICNVENGATINCHTQACQKSFHIMCAIQAGQRYGFDITPVKSTRRDDSVVTLGQDIGKMSTAIWCKEHGASLKTNVHALNELVDESGLTSLQKYVLHSKQADLTLTGTTRKANQLDAYTFGSAELRRVSTSGPTKTRSQKDWSADIEKPRKCIHCNVDASPRWWNVERFAVQKPTTQDITMVNGFKAESPSRESSMRVEALLSNGTGSPHLERNLDAAATTGHSRAPSNGHGISESIVGMECHKCHLRQGRPVINDDAMDVQQTVETPVRRSSPTISSGPGGPFPPTWSLSNIPEQPPTHGTWPLPQYNGSPHASSPHASSPQQFVAHPPPYAAPRPREGNYPPPDAVYAPPGAGPPTHHYAPVPTNHPPPPPVPSGAPVYPPPPPIPHHAQNLANGLPPHSPPRNHPMHPPRASGSPYHGPPPPAPTHGYNYEHHHQPPPQASHYPPPPPPQPTHSSHHNHPPPPPIPPPVAVAPRPSAHGASNSPSLRNLLG